MACQKRSNNERKIADSKPSNNLRKKKFFCCFVRFDINHKNKNVNAENDFNSLVLNVIKSTKR